MHVQSSIILNKFVIESVCYMHLFDASIFVVCTVRNNTSHKTNAGQMVTLAVIIIAFMVTSVQGNGYQQGLMPYMECVMISCSLHVHFVWASSWSVIVTLTIHMPFDVCHLRLIINLIIIIMTMRFIQFLTALAAWTKFLAVSMQEYIDQCACTAGTLKKRA